MAEVTAPKSKSKSAIDDTNYTITFAGVYFAKDPNSSVGSNIEKKYKITVNMKHSHVNTHGAKSVFKKHATALMLQKYPDFQSLSTYHIVASECDRPELLEKNLNVLSRDGLLSYIDNESLDINVHLYDDTDALRNAIVEYNADPDTYAKNQAALETRMGGTLKVRDEFLKMNADFDPDADEDLDDSELTVIDKDIQTGDGKTKTPLAKYDKSKSDIKNA